MKLCSVLVPVPDPQDIVLVTVQTGEGHLLEVGHHLLLLILGGAVLRSERQDTGGIFPFPVDGVDEVADPFGIPAAHHPTAKAAVRAFLAQNTPD